MKGTMMNTEKGIILSKSLVALVNCFFSRRVKMFPFRSLMISLEPVTSSLPNNLVLIHTCFKPFFVDFQALALLALAYSHHCQMRRKYNVWMGQELSSQDKTVFRGSLRKNQKKNRTGNHTQALERYKEVLEVGAISSYLFLFPYRMRTSDCELYESHRQGSLICLMHEK